MEPIMRTLNKYSSCFGLVLTLFALTIFGCSCSAQKPTPDPLAGWQEEYLPEPSDQILEKDYHDYIRNLPPGEQEFIGPVFFFKDGTGQHAAQIEVDIGGKDCWHHILFYDKENKRIKVVKYFYGRYVS